MKHRLPLLLFLLLALLPVSASAVGMVTEARYDTGKLVLTAYADDDTVTVKSGKPSDIILLLDASSGVGPYINEIKAAVTKFIGTVSDEPGDDRLALITYTDAVKSSTGILYLSEEEAEVWSNFVRSQIRKLDGDPNVEAALDNAKTVLKNSDTTRNQIVILLYDSSATTTDAARAAAIAAAKVVKDDGVELFCVDYAAQAQTDFAAALATGHFNKTTDLSVSGDFTAVLAKIVRQMGGTVYRPDAKAELRATLSDVFTVPSADQIRVRAEECRLFPGETPAGWEEQALLTNYTVKVEGQTVTVTGFDYSANAVYKDGLGLHGARLVVEIPLTWSATSGTDTILTSGKQATSGVYFDKARLEPFTAPPSVTFTEGTYTVVHQQTDGTIDKTTIHHILKGQADDLTTKVSPNYLYGGLVSGTPFADGENTVSFTPTPNATYTIREVPATYLRPYVYSVWREDGGQKNVTGLCLLTTADGASYLNVGFDMDRQKSQAAALCNTVTVKQGSTVADRLIVTDGRLTSNLDGSSTGQIGYHVLNEGEFASFRSTPLTFRPYWITNDGIRVTGQTVWTCTHRGTGPDTAYEFVKISPRTGASSTKWVGTDA